MTTKGAEPITKKPATPAKPVANKNPQKSNNGVLGFFVFLTFFIAIGGLGAAYYYWQELQKTIQAAEVERNALKHALTTVDENPRFQKFSNNLSKKLDSNSNELKALEDNVKTLKDTQQKLSSSVEKTTDLLSRGEKSWMLLEVEHVLRMAQHRLLLDRDFDGAIAGLQASDARLKEIDDIRLIPIRRSVSNQIQILNNYPHPDYVGIQLELDNTIAELKNGLIKKAETVAQEDKENQKPNDSEQPDTSPETPAPAINIDFEKIFETSLDFIKDTVDKAKSKINESVQITHGEQKVAVFIEQQEKKRDYEFLRQKLLAAKYSVSSRDNMAFQQQLGAAMAWLESNDEYTNKETLINNIKKLSELDLSPELPDISEPSLLLATYIEKTKDRK